MTIQHDSGLVLIGHPFSSFCQKVAIALGEHGRAFRYDMLDFGNAAAVAAFAETWPLKRMPVLFDDGRAIFESTIIIEHLDLHATNARRLLPPDPRAALEVRFMDRMFDQYIMTPMQRIVFDVLRPEGERDPRGVVEARALLDTTYAWLEPRLAGRTWAAGDAFSLADCAAAPALFYADWVHRIPETVPLVRQYRARLLARPSVKHVVDQARPHRHLFPLGAPDRD